MSIKEQTGTLIGSIYRVVENRMGTENELLSPEADYSLMGPWARTSGGPSPLLPPAVPPPRPVLLLKSGVGAQGHPFFQGPLGMDPIGPGANPSLVPAL